jgi:hypothetical protein
VSYWTIYFVAVAVLVIAWLLSIPWRARRIVDGPASQFRKHRGVHLEDAGGGVMLWSLQDAPPYTLPWGFVYPPRRVTVVEPSPEYRCHALTGEYTKRVFSIIVPCGEHATLFEPGGEFIPYTTEHPGQWRDDCPHVHWSARA